MGSQLIWRRIQRRFGRTIQFYGVTKLGCRNGAAIRAIGSGQYEAVYIPQSFRLGPKLADRLNVITNWESAFKQTPLISEDRRKFLISRIPYWQAWARNGKGVWSTGDVE